MKGNSLKWGIITAIKNALTENIDYEQFEQKILILLKSEFISGLKNNPNDFIYFLEILDESSFDDIIYMLKKQGVFNFLDLKGIDNDLINQIKKNMIRFNIQKEDFQALGDINKNLLNQLVKALCEIKDPEAVRSCR